MENLKLPGTAIYLRGQSRCGLARPWNGVLRGAGTRTEAPEPKSLLFHPLCLSVPQLPHLWNGNNIMVPTISAESIPQILLNLSHTTSST